MTVKITLVTPPDIFENDNLSIMLFNVTEEQQHAASQWFLNYEKTDHLNIYFHTNETDVPWLLHAMAVSKYKYINIDCVNYITQALSGYALTRNGTFYKTTDENLASVYSHINSNRIDRVETFLKSILGE